jgi:hypothetical protein
VIEEKIAGRVYVRDASGRLLVELRKEPIYPVQLGLGPGRYHVTVDADGRAFQANVTLEPGKSTRLGQPQLAIAPTEPAAARGGGRAPLPPGVGPGGAPRQPAVAPPPPPTVAAAAPATPQRRLGIYGGVALRYARLDDRNGMFWGGEAGLLLWRRFVVGLSTTRASVGEAQDFRGIVNMRFDALALRYRFLFEGSRFDLTAGVLVGMGHLSRPPAGIDPGLTTGTTTVVLEQQVEAHVAPTRWLRLGVDLGFRIAPGADSGVAGDIQSITTGLHAQLSWF